jgi:tetraprenyl-beta-curcumene synthase
MSSSYSQLTRPAREATLPQFGRVRLDRLLVVRATFALLQANARYWPTVAPRVRSELARWTQAAGAIADPVLRDLAFGKLADERFNVEVAATLATLAPRAHRKTVVEAIVALQVLYDYLDVLGERPSADPQSDSERLSHAFIGALKIPAESPSASIGAFGTPAERPPASIDALDTPAEDTSAIRETPRCNDNEYLDRLARAVALAIARLPGHDAIVEVAEIAAARCAQAQVLNHAAAKVGTSELEQRTSAQAREWATVEARGTGLGWQEYLAGACASVLSIHALIAAAADPTTTRTDAVSIDSAYLSIGALTMLDSVVDHEQDLATGQPGYLQYYSDPELLSDRLARLARDSAVGVRTLPHAAHHLMMRAGVAAYYLSSPGADSDFARRLTGRVHDELRPLITPTLALMRGWRAAKRVRR